MQYKNPVISTNNHKLTSGFGVRNIGAGLEMHNGCDYVDAKRLELKQDVAIIAIADGTVVEVINGSQVGWTVAIAHESKILSRYQHMKNNSVRVKSGDKVKKGQMIGIMGNTGRSTGIHLHFAIKENSTSYTNGIWVDPSLYLTGTKTIGSNSPQPPAVDFATGNKVRIKQGAKTYTGGNLASFVYNTIYEIAQITNDRAVVGIRDKITNQINITAAINTRDLIKI